MSQDYGISVPSAHRPGAPSKALPARYLIVIDSGGASVARLFLATRVQVAEFDGGAEEVSSLSNGLQATNSATGSEWDRALSAHTVAERSAAEVYTLDL